MTPGIMIRSRAYHGTPRPSETRPAHSGSTRSKAAAKIMRVDDSHNVPAQPTNHVPNPRRIKNIMNGSSSQVSPLSPKSSGEPPATNPSFAVALAMVALYASETPNRLWLALSNAAWNVSTDDTAIRTNTTASAASPIQMHQ